jgi:hypothetical protein
MSESVFEVLEMLSQMQPPRPKLFSSESFFGQREPETVKRLFQPSEPTLDELLPHTSPEARMASDFLNGCTELGSSRTGLLTER